MASWDTPRDVWGECNILKCLVFFLTISSAQSYGRSDDFVFTQREYNATIHEKAVGKTYVVPSRKMGIVLHNPLDITELKYKISSGQKKLFKTERKIVGDFGFLFIRTRSNVSPINREKTDLYELQIRGIGRYRNGSVLTAETTIVISVLDVNDGIPLFNTPTYPSSYQVSIGEDTPLHSSITQVTASDSDIGVNGEIYYSFLQKTNMFAIHPTNGVVTLTRPLNFAEQKMYKLSVIAKDRGLKKQTRENTAELTIDVTQVNFNKPEIKTVQHSSVYEGKNVGIVYAVLQITDRDEGRNGEIQSVQIIDGDPMGYFDIQEKSKGEYTIEVSRALDREISPSGYNLTIQAQDRGVPPKTSTIQIAVNLLDKNDEVPKFKQNYTISVNETVPVNTPLLFVSAIDRDLGRNAKLEYSITKGNELNWFGIRAGTGLLYTVKELDAEILTEVTLTVRAVDQGLAGSRRQGQTKVKISILDCNDNSPVFDEIRNTIKIEENQPVGTFVYKIRARDKDRYDNGYVSYSLVNIGQVPFKIGHFNGKIETTKVLDFETMPQTYKLRVRASDWGSPYRRETEKTITVMLTDVNDNKPMFEKINCEGYLSQDAPVGTRLVTVSAIDLDTLFAVVNLTTYSIVAGNDDRCFQLNASSGKLTLNCDITSARIKQRSIVIRAFDDVRYSENMTVNVTLVKTRDKDQLADGLVKIHCTQTDATKLVQAQVKLQEENKKAAERYQPEDMNSRFSRNRFQPRFHHGLPTAQTNIDEDKPVGEVIFHAGAYDEDSGYNGMLVYVIGSGNEDSTFKVDTYSGNVMVMSPVDREKKQMYTLNITVFDLGQPSKASSLILTVYVSDVNDYAPKFKRLRYYGRVSENDGIGTIVTTVSAEDHDLGSSAEFRYSIVSDQKDFSIHNFSGVIKIAKPLDRERQEKYDLVVQATDNGKDHKLSSTTIVSITVTDVNDQPPKFVPEVYNVRVREDLPVGAVVMTITAHDPDLGQGSVVRYNLQSGMDDKFEVDRLTGTIRISKTLNFESKQFYNITARARDRGTPTLSSTCQILIEIIDVNENLYVPTFKNFYEIGVIKENEKIGTQVLRVNAKDRDKGGLDKDIEYSIREGSGLGRFTIDRRGVIRTSAILDRESMPHYWLTVYAQDRGAVPLSSSIEVLIKVEDQNDNVPLASEAVYYVNVTEHSRANTTVVQIKAFDADQDSRLTYKITGGNPQGFFQIDQNTGLINTTRRILDRENQDEHILEVTISDNGSPALSSTTQVVVTIEDENDQQPIFTEKLYRVRILETDRLDQPLFRVVASDGDIGYNGVIDYQENHPFGKKFRVHPKKGYIYALRPLEVGRYTFQVEAIDNGRPTQKRDKADVSITVMKKPEVNEYPPEPFFFDTQECKVAEDIKVGKKVCYPLEGQDPDENKIWYYITDGNTDDRFFINVETGTIRVAMPLDREKQSRYNLTISLFDGKFTTHTWVGITVVDTNDNRPQFKQKIYTAEISENADVGTRVVAVTATDEDQDKRKFYTIHSASHDASVRLFHINSETGVITTSERLDRESIAEHQLTIMVRDLGIHPLRSLTRVVIKITDHNDHAPEFLSDLFVGRIFETAALGTSVVQVLATDKDKGENAVIDFSIASGNIGNTFNIDKTLGIISVAKELDHMAFSEYNLVVRATDQGKPSMSSTAQVKIYVTVSNNAPPKFDSEEYTAEIKENEPEGTFVTIVSAISQSSLVYEIMGDASDYFTINPNSGVMATKQMFDFDVDEFKSFNVTVRAGNMVGAEAFAFVFVHVIDENDNAPMFTAETYVGEISEAAALGSVVLDNSSVPLVVKATDKDSNLNAFKIYSIVEKEAQKVFSIDTNTGAIRTNSLLDHEQFAVYHFTVQVTDKGIPQRSAVVPAKVTINVIDVNDSPPKFNKASYSTTLLLPTYEEVAVILVTATDPDTKVNSKLVYSITGGNHDGKFEIESETGIIRVINDTDLASQYVLDVEVTDGKFVTMTQVEINVRESDKTSKLRFTDDAYYAEIIENLLTKEVVCMVQVSGYSLNEHLTFSILNPSPMFSIGKTSGVVQTTGIPFDRELRDKYKVVVEVRDNNPNPQIAHVIVHVTIMDQNDNAPMFVNQPYYAVVSVEAKDGDVIKKVQAIDHDIGDNGKVRYQLVQGDDGKFQVNKRTGEIIVTQALDTRDQHQEYTLVIEAVDRGKDPMRNRVVVPVRVMNKATPVFDHQYYAVNVSEDVKLHSSVLSIQAKSPNNQKLIYSITAGNKYDEFAVDFETGAITVIQDLDYEMVKRYELTVRATDTLTGSYAEAIVTITLTDVNDNEPSFDKLIYTEKVSEAITVGTPVLRVTAKDIDSGANSLVHYSLENTGPGNNDSDYFYIDNVKGYILVKEPLDHERKSKMHFIVKATDSGSPSKSSVAHVFVDIIDLNDNPPVFDQPSYSATITDQAKRDQFVTMVTASDADSSSAGELTYSIVNGNTKNAFMVDRGFGIITLSSLRKPDLEPIYNLNVSVTDGVFTSFTRVTVHVKNSNNHSPVFTQLTYSIDLHENVPAGRSIYQVTARDKDLGKYGTVQYSIVSKEMAEEFEIDENTGEITTLERLDREREQEYVIPVAAKDGGGRVGFTNVNLKILDKDDNKPLFYASQYKANIYFTADVGEVVVKVKAIDKDSGAEVEYSIIDGKGGQASKLFEVDRETGEIKVKKSLENHINDVFQFFVRATSGTVTVPMAEVPVEILVMNTDLYPPKMEAQSEPSFVSEDKPTQSPVASVTATSNETLVYSIIAGQTDTTNNPEKFTIDSTGTITIKEALDHEVTQMYVLLVRAETQTIPSLVAHGEVTIKVQDVNDNPPHFASDPYVSSIAENEEIGTTLIQVVAKDNDTGSNAQVSYSFDTDASLEIVNLFSIDPQTGWITTLAKLDREMKSYYELKVVATDSGKKVKMSSTTTVQVEVTDHNDEPPIFSPKVYPGTVAEDALPGTFIVAVTTNDADIDSNAEVTYYITDGDPLGQFKIHRNGQIYVSSLLDREEIASYTLTVTATDGVFVTHARVEITVIDYNDNDPVCLPPLHQFILKESHPVGQMVGNLRATDADQANTIHAKLTYTLEGPEAYMFDMDEKFGILTTVAPLDREAIPQYRLIMKATDGGGRFCTAEIFINIQDENDNPPEFVDKQFTHIEEYNMTISESAEVNTLLTRVTATDEDLGINGKVRFSLDDSSGHFHCDETSGIISLKKPLDREVQSSYNLVVKAFDQGTPSLTSTAKLNIRVTDVNDNPPEFERMSYFANVSEDTRIGNTVLVVIATSRDEGQNAEISYSIIGGNEKGVFNIDRQTGVITTQKELDYEQVNEFLLTIRASDHGEEPLHNNAVVRINVTDTNDNYPEFGKETLPVNIREDIDIGSKVIQVQATDKDSGKNAEIHYRISNGDNLEQFAIDPFNGQIRVATPLDREEFDHYSLEVTAQDGGNPARMSTITIEIEILDANDNPPKFSQANYTAVVQVDKRGHSKGRIFAMDREDRDVGYRALKFTVTDADRDPNGPPFKFDIVSRNHKDKFSIDRNGILSTRARFNRKIKDTYELTVRAYDNGVLFSDVPLTVKIIEEPAYPPELDPLELSISSYLDDFPGGVIGRVKARDKDKYDKLSYSIGADNTYKHLFNIGVDNGTITAEEGLDEGVYVLNVSVTDGKFTAFSPVTLQVSVITEDMVEHAVIIRFGDTKPEQFISRYRKLFFKAVKGLFNVRNKDIHILSLQPASASLRRKRSTSSASDLDVLVAIKKSHSLYFPKNKIRKRLDQEKDNISSLMGVEVLDIFHDVCTINYCKQGACKTMVTFEDKVTPYITDGESYVAAGFSMTPECQCEEGYGGETCSRIVNECYRQPCSPYQQCRPTATSYTCECPPGKQGPQCQYNIPDDIKTEMKPITFTGKSYARWRLTESMERSLVLSLKIKTVQNNAVIMHASGKADYSILEIKDGRIQYRFDCGSGVGAAKISETHINDGEWHVVEVDARLNHARINLDGRYSAEDTAPGSHVVLNLSDKDIYFGAQVDEREPGYTDIRNGFQGCLSEIKIRRESLPYVGTNNVATVQKFANVEFKCENLQEKGVCRSRPCMNGGKCILTSDTGYICRCQDRFKGRHCEIDTDPCASNPCMYGGICQNLSNDFKCECVGKYTGKRCDYGRFCIPNPCFNDGRCDEGDTKAICNCNGFEGERCEKDIDECAGDNPCKNGGQCQNLYGAFLCNCSAGTSGNLCQEIGFAEITSTSWNISLEEIGGIAGVVAGLILIVIIFVIVRKWRVRKKRREERQRLDALDNDPDHMILNCNQDDFKRNKLSNIDVAQNIPPPSPRPPPVPNRPASYTPSNHDSLNTLNNFDSVRNYGSAADDLETSHLPIIIPEFLQNLNVQKNTASMVPSLPTLPPSNSCSDSESIQKPAWEFEYPVSNNLETFNGGDFKNPDKQMPNNFHPPPPRDSGSMSSLQESDNDEPAPSNLTRENLRSFSAANRGKKRGYHWDCSDWAPNPQLPNITEVPVREVPDSPGSSSRSNHSNESNTLVGTDPMGTECNYNADDSEYPECDSEYVGDSEYADNDDEDDLDDPDDRMDFPEPPNFEQLLQNQGDHYDDNFQPGQHNYNLHPNAYLPNYHVDANGDNWPEPPARMEANGNLNDQDDVAPYGFPRGVPRRFALDYGSGLEFSDYEPASNIDDMSVSMGGYTSTNASCSDISGLCEIEDSEINLSDNDSDMESYQKMSNAHLHTQV